MNTVYDSYSDLTDALHGASEYINKLLDGTGFHFAWEYPGFAAFTNQDNSITVAATPAWDGDCVSVQITDDEGDQIDGTEDIEDIILDELTINDYVKKVYVVLMTVSLIQR